MTESTHSIRNTKLLQMQALPLEQKIEATKRRIREWLERYPEASVSFSGGKDSTVLLHIARQVKKDIPVYFSNTGLEYPEIVEFVKQTGGVEIVRPKVSFLEVVQKYGYPVVSKSASQKIREIRNTNSDKLRELRLHGSNCQRLPKKWQFLTEAPFKISDQCCKHLKKNPLDSLGGYPIIGTMAQDSDQRLEMYFKHGCNAYDLARPRSTPLSFWKEEDIWEYLRRFNVPYSKIYDMGYTRTGCMFCMFGLHMEAKPNRFDRMQTTHPQLYRYCMDGPLNLRFVIDYVYNEHERRKELLK